MTEFALALLVAVRVFFRTRRDTALEILALRHQVAVLKRKRPRSPTGDAIPVVLTVRGIQSNTVTIAVQ
jgi:hypothetical protein